MKLVRLWAGRLSPRERSLGLIAGVLVLLNLVLPIWEVLLRSQQYPEGLHLIIYARSLAGDLPAINTLNDIIGMKPLTVGSFAEFTWLSPVLAFVGLFLIGVSLLGRRVGMLVGWIVLWAFDGFMLWDFYRWMYQWGHDLDPRAPFKIAPFTPPLIGYEHVANFHIFSFPLWGGALIVIASLLGLYQLWYAVRSSV